MKKRDIFYSRFFHVFEKNGVIALYNSLKMKPVFMSKEVVLLIEDLVRGDGGCLKKSNLASSESVAHIIQHLKEAKILLEDLDADDRAISYFRERFTGRPYVSIAYFILTEACNFRCNYCFVLNRFEEKQEKSFMDCSTAEKGLNLFCGLIKENMELWDNEKTIILYGGEPLLNKKTLVFLLERIGEKKTLGELPEKTSISMVTNGSLIDEDISKIMFEYGVNVAVSIDGGSFSTNSERKYLDGRPVFEDAVRGFKLLKKDNVDVGLSCTLNEKSLEDFEDTVNFLVNELGTDSLGFNMMIESKNFSIPSSYSSKVTEAMIAAFKIFRERNIFEDRMMRKVEAFAKNRVYPFDCGASGGNQIVIAPKGEIGICHGYLGTKKYFFSSLDENDQSNLTKHKDMKEWSLRSPLNIKECEACPALGICGGGCPLSADYQTGSIWGLEDRFCTHAKKVLEWLVWDLYERSSK